MHLICVCHILVLLGLSQVQLGRGQEFDLTAQLQSEMHFPPLGRRPIAGIIITVNRRVVRQVLSSLNDQQTFVLEKLIVRSCNSTAEPETLQETFDELKECIKNKTIFVTPKAEYLEFIKECSKDAVRVTKDCLPEDHKYFPDLVLAIAQSQISFMYDDFDLVQGEIVACFKKFDSYEAVSALLVCLTDKSKDIPVEERNDIPPSKSIFCKRFIDNDYCFINSIRDTCKSTPDILKYTEDYINAHKRACEE